MSALERALEGDRPRTLLMTDDPDVARADIGELRQGVLNAVAGTMLWSRASK